ncbi:ACT domain-containing protein [Candidatus Micrarchaeota archaeon]|nr:ACT domain-containing protein [Candidatus Micrarchaeota archaeon]
MKELTIFAEDRVGLLAKISNRLSEKKINIDYISGESIGGTAVLHIVVKDGEKVKKILEEAGFLTALSDVLVLKLKDRPGEMGTVAAILAFKGVNIRSVYSLEKKGNEGIFAFKVDDIKKAKEAVKSYVYTKMG